MNNYIGIPEQQGLNVDPDYLKIKPNDKNYTEKEKKIT